MIYSYVLGDSVYLCAGDKHLCYWSGSPGLFVSARSPNYPWLDFYSESEAIDWLIS